MLLSVCTRLSLFCYSSSSDLALREVNIRRQSSDVLDATHRDLERTTQPVEAVVLATHKTTQIFLLSNDNTLHGVRAEATNLVGLLLSCL